MPPPLSRVIRLYTTLCMMVVASAASAQTAARPETPIGFSREILPLLSDHCFACHGPDEKARKGGLRLDTLAGARGSGKSGKTAITPGRPDESEILRRIHSSDPDEVMPPRDSGKALKPEQVRLLRQWIEQEDEL